MNQARQVTTPETRSSELDALARRKREAMLSTMGVVAALAGALGVGGLWLAERLGDQRHPGSAVVVGVTTLVLVVIVLGVGTLFASAHVEGTK